MFKTLVKYIGEFKRDAILTPVLVVMEVIMEVIIPIIMAVIIDYIQVRHAQGTEWEPEFRAWKDSGNGERKFRCGGRS